MRRTQQHDSSREQKSLNMVQVAEWLCGGLQIRVLDNAGSSPALNSKKG
jgi:hypothetical protein